MPGSALRQSPNSTTPLWVRPGMSSASDTRKVGSIYVQVLGGGTWDLGAPGLVISCQRNDVCNYLINCGEGTQRFCFEHKLRITGKLRRVLLTRLTWDAVGGLPGMLLTMSDAGHAGSLKVHGPRHTAQLVESFAGVVRRDSLPSPTDEVRDCEAMWLDESGISAVPLLLDPSASHHATEECEAATESVGEAPPVGRACVDHVADKECLAGSAVAASTPERAAKRARLMEGHTDIHLGSPNAKPSLEQAFPAAKAVGTAAQENGAHPAASLSEGVDGHTPPGWHTDISESNDPVTEQYAGLQPGQGGGAAGAQALCWLLCMPPIPPKFSPEAAFALGVPRGPLYGQLRGGKPVLLPSGDEVRPEQVLSGGGRGEIVLLIDCRVEEHVQLLRRHPLIQRHGVGGEGQTVDVVIHMTPPPLCHSAGYAEWSRSLPASTAQCFVDLTPQVNSVA